MHTYVKKISTTHGHIKTRIHLTLFKTVPINKLDALYQMMHNIFCSNKSHGKIKYTNYIKCTFCV